MSAVLTTRIKDVLFVTLNDPPTRNALSSDMVAGLQASVDMACNDASVRALVLRGSRVGDTSSGKRFFCAGGNVSGFKERLEQLGSDPNYGVEQSETRRLGSDPNCSELRQNPIALNNRTFGTFMQSLAACPAPVIAVVEGAAMGGGLGLACAADLVLAQTDAKFALTETTLGIIPAQIAPFVVQRIGAAAAKRLALFGERFTAKEALGIGLVDAVAEDESALDALLVAWLTRLAGCAPAANRACKPLLIRSTGEAHSEKLSALLDDSALAFSICMQTEGKEGIAAFREKRKPTWAVEFTAEEVRGV